MVRKNVLLLLGGAAVLIVLAAAGYIFRPITIFEDGTATRHLRAPVWTVSQALAEAGVELDSDDRVEPSLDQPVPGNGQIQIRRAAFAYLWDEGRLRPLSGTDRTPADLLRSAGIVLNPGDRLLRNGLPLDAHQPLPPHQTVILQIARPREVRVSDGVETQTVTTAGPTAAHALRQAGIIPGPGDILSVPAGTPVEGLVEVAYEAARPLTIQVGEQTIHTRSAADSVGQALREAGAALQGLDYSLPAEDQPLPQDGLIQVVRVREEVTLVKELVPYGQQSELDPELALDQRRVIQAGKYGVNVTRERARFENGQEVARAVDSNWAASEPQDQTVGYGTKAVPQTMDTPDGQIEYYRELRVYATSYSPCRLGVKGLGCNHQTSSGAQLTKGIIAVTLPWYRMMAGQRVYIPGYGYGVIADVGGGIPGTPWIDLGFSEEDYQPMIGWMTMYLLTPVPAYVPWALPY